MHGSGGEQRKQRRHMLPVHSNSKTVAADLSASAFFLKDGRKIHVGDCALFKPPLDSPPFIGIIRRLKTDKENGYCLDVNWLYRPAEIKLAKGILLDAAPNEVFYSFHKDEIPAASLLHPCKVAFLRKGVELPSGLSSFVCRRVYDTDHKCLWWLTDKDYINERQEEVDQLLDKTRLEMHGAMQSGGCSPKPLDGPTSVLQSNPCSDGLQNSSSFTLQVKNRKRERVDQGSEPAKRECLLKTEDGEFDQKNTLKYEISKITDNKGLVDIEEVEKLIKHMQLDSVKKIDLVGRILLVDVVAATDRLDCLGWFLQLGGLPVLDEWLQEVHKGKICEGSSLKESDKSIDEFLFSLLRALEKLPVNLPALQTCNIGKSVNHLRTHKNSDIQRKSKSLVDTWKKRVKAEMNENDAKSGLTHGASWSTKPVISEGPNTTSRKSGISAECGLKSSSTRPTTPKSSQVKFSPTEIIAQSSISSEAVKSPPAMAITSKDQNLRTADGAGALDSHVTPIKDERSSSSSQSQSNSQSSDYAKTMTSSCKEDGNNSTSGSRNRVSGSASHHRKSTKSHRIGNVSAAHKETISGKVLSSSRNFISEKLPPTSHDKLSDSSFVDHGNSQLIVRLPNTIPSPCKIASEDSPEHLVVAYSRSSPSTERPGSCDNKVMGKRNIILSIAATDVNSDGKEGLCGSEHGSELSPNDKHGEENEVPFDVSKSASLSMETMSKSRKSHEASLSSMNALIESCAKFSECMASPGDEVGMNLLATVAAEEMAKSSNVSLLDSSGINSPVTDNPSSLNTKGLNQSCEEVVHAKFNASDADCLFYVPGVGDKTENVSGSLRKLEDCNGHLNSSSLHLQPNMDGSDSKLDGMADLALPSLNFGKEGNAEDMRIPNSHDETEKEIDARATENCTVVDSEVTQENKVDEKALCESLDMGINNQTNTALTDTILSDKVSPLASEISSNIMEGKTEDAVKVNGTGNMLDIEDAVKVNGTGNMLDMKSKCDMVDHAKLGCNAVHIGGQIVNLSSNASEVRGDCSHENMKENETSGCSSQATSHESPSLAEDNQQNHKLIADSTDDSYSRKSKDSSENAPFSRSDPSVKLNFDLNECFFVDDADQAELDNHADAENSFPLKFSCPLPSSISSKSLAFPASITVASAAKGPVVPPENLSRTNGELGWKGSAATSAFRPAEPRKNLVMPLSMSNQLYQPENLVMPSIVVGTMSKQGCPPLNFDLNVPDDSLLEEIASESAPGPPYPGAGALDLDLNKVEQSSDFGSLSMGSGLQSRSSLHITHGGVNVSRDFDLNNGPCMEEMGTELPTRFPKNKNIVPIQSNVPSLAVNSVELGNFSSLFSPRNFSALTAVPSIFPGRGDQSYLATTGSQRLLVSPAATNPFAAEMYRGQVLSSSPAMPFPPSTPFPHHGFSFDTSFSMSSSSFSGCSTGYMDSTSGGSLCYPSIPPQLAGHTGLVSTSYPRPYIMSFPGASNNVGPDNGKWGKLGLDLNTGPGVSDVERRDERFASSLRHFPVTNSQSLVDEPVKIFQVGGLKRKEADGGSDLANRFRTKQSPRQ